MKVAKSLTGIISSLSTTHAGNVHEKGVVALTSKSVLNATVALKNVADLTQDSEFKSKNEPGQWVCWDFRDARVHATGYTASAYALRTWIIEGSLDGNTWTVVDRHADNQDFRSGWKTASFAVSKPAEFRYVRLTQTAKDHSEANHLHLRAVEFFGTLSQ
jgi:hypothetical protein